MEALISVKKMVVTTMVIVGMVFCAGVALIIALMAKGIDGHAINWVFDLVFIGVGGIEFLMAHILEKMNKAIVKTARMLKDNGRYTAEVEQELTSLLRKERFREMMAQVTTIE